MNDLPLFARHVSDWTPLDQIPPSWTTPPTFEERVMVHGERRKARRKLEKVARKRQRTK